MLTNKISFKLFSDKKLPIILTLILGILLRVFFLGTPNFIYDECYSWYMAIASFKRFVEVTVSHEVNMVLFYYVSRFWVLINSSETFLRSFCVIFGVANIFLIYKFAQILFKNNTIAILAGFIAAINSFQISHDQNFRSYSMAVCLVLISSIFLFKSFSPDTDKGKILNYQIVWILSLVLATYAHLLVTICCMIHFLFLLDRKEYKNFIKYAFVYLFLVSPLIYFICFLTTHQLDWIPRFSHDSLIIAINSISGSNSTAFSIALFCLVLLFGAFRVLREKSSEYKYIFAWFVGYFACLLITGFYYNNFYNRYLIFLMPAFNIVIAYEFYRMFKDNSKFVKILTSIFFILFLACSFEGLQSYYKKRLANKLTSLKMMTDSIVDLKDDQASLIIMPFNITYRYLYFSRNADKKPNLIMPDLELWDNSKDFTIDFAEFKKTVAGHKTLYVMYILLDNKSAFALSSRNNSRIIQSIGILDHLYKEKKLLPKSKPGGFIVVRYSNPNM